MGLPYLSESVYARNRLPGLHGHVAPSVPLYSVVRALFGFLDHVRQSSLSPGSSDGNSICPPQEVVKPFRCIFATSHSFLIFLIFRHFSCFSCRDVLDTRTNIPQCRISLPFRYRCVTCHSRMNHHFHLGKFIYNEFLLIPSCKKYGWRDTDIDEARRLIWWQLHMPGLTIGFPSP